MNITLLVELVTCEYNLLEILNKGPTESTDRTMVNSFTIVSLIVMLQTCVSYSSNRCYYVNSYCSWETWGSWNIDCTCGVKDVLRIRTRYCRGNYAPFYTCRYHDTCKPLCYNGGTFNYKEDRCDCSERFSGKCCKEGKSDI